MKINFILGAIASLMTTVNCQATKPYNVLLIVADDMNEYGFFHTNPVVKTPNLDDFRKSALSFRNSYCPAPACSPSRSAFLSGISPHKSGKYYNGSNVWTTPMFEQQEIVPEWFQRIGYKTYGKGKLFHSDIPNERVERVFMGTTGKAGFGPFPDEQHQTLNRFFGIQAFPDSVFPDVLNAQSVCEILQDNHEQPFFILYGLWRPHTPLTCPQRFFDMYKLDEIDLPPGYLENDLDDLPDIAKAYIKSKQQHDKFDKLGSDMELWKEFLRGYYACYTFADYNIGKVLTTLDNSPYANNTIVIITSDNGFHMGEKERFDKNSLWELSAITPMAIRIPGSPHAGKICTQPVNLQDLYPTFVDYCGNGIKPQLPIDGHSLKPLLENPEAAWEYPSLTFFGKGWTSVRTGQYRYLSYPDGSDELYDHTTDTWELNNLANDPHYTEVIKELKQHVPKEMANSIPGKWTTQIQNLEKEMQQEK